MLWAIFALLTGVAVLAILWPLARRPKTCAPAALDVAFYEAQIAEIDADAEAGRIAPADVETARAEAARRLMAAAEKKRDTLPAVSRRNVRIAAIATVIFIPAMVLLLYGRIGHPDWPDLPLEARLKASPERMDLAAAIAKIEAHLANNPEDGRGFEVLASAYLRMGRAEDAIHASETALRLLGESPERRAFHGETLVYAAGGVVTPEARRCFEKALEKDRSLPKALFFLGLAAEQEGDKPRALDYWHKLLAQSPEDAPWTPVLRARIAALEENPDARAAAIAALPSSEQELAIKSMVDSLAARLAKDGHDIEGWLRLVRAYKVLNEPEKARSALRDARQSFGQNEAAMVRLDALARELGLEG
jgi:cytochrome c-type biogenesis protein CcmH